MTDSQKISISIRRDRKNGQFGHGFDTLCTCGHTKGNHTADKRKHEGKWFQPCIVGDFGAPFCNCECFTKAR